MRKIGSLPSNPLAVRFHNYLTANGIQNRVDPIDGGWEVWVYEEEQVPQARTELDAFTTSPEDSKYTAVIPVKPVAAPVAQPKGRRPARETTLAGSHRLRLTIAICAISFGITLGSDFGKHRELLQGFWLAPPGHGLTDLLHGEFWRLYTPMFLHFSPFHLAADIYMFFLMGGAIERFRGTRMLLWLILLIAPVSHLVQYYDSIAPFGGLSGVVYGLFGFLWIRSKFLPEDGFYMPEVLVTQMILWAVLGLTGALGDIANGAHFGGLFAGVILGAAPRLWRDR